MAIAEPPTVDTAARPPALRRELERRAELRTMKRRATGLLLAVTATYLVLLLTTDDVGVAGFALAAAEAGMVGGLADWFAVTALFRHPLGIPIPHTAVIRSRKDQFGQTLAEFVQEQFLSGDVLADRVRAAGPADRLTQWLSEPSTPPRIAGHVAELAVRLTDAVRDDEVTTVIEDQVRRRVAAIEVAPAASRLLRTATAEGRHHEVIDAVLRGLDHFLAENEATLRARFAERSLWWIPETVDDRIFNRLLDGVRAIIADRDGELRDRLDEWVVRSVDRLEHDPDWRARLEDLKQELLARPELRHWATAVWADVKAEIRSQAARPESELRDRLAGLVTAVAERLARDPALRASIDERAAAAARQVAEQFHDEITDLISGTVARWDADETADRLELLLGPDLQFIRINGTVVGALAGVGIHSLATVVG